MSEPVAPRQSLGTTRQIRAAFATQAALDTAMEALARRGFDRTELSLPGPTSDAAAAQPTTQTDRQQARTLGGSTAGVVAALGGAVVTVATGGAAIAAVGVAAAAGLAAGGAAHAVIAGGGRTQKNARDTAANKGELVLAVAVRDPERDQVARQVLEECGAASVEFRAEA